MTKKYNSIKKGRCSCSGSGLDTRYEVLEIQDPGYMETLEVADVIELYQKKGMQILSENEKSILRDYMLGQVPESITVYRGQKTSKEIRNAPFFSCSKDKIEARRFAGNYCCLFTIHVVDAQLIDINRFMRAWVGPSPMEDEEEVLVLGGGTFYKNEEMTEEGFAKLDKTKSFDPYFKSVVEEYECWYSSVEAIV